MHCIATTTLPAHLPGGMMELLLSSPGQRHSSSEVVCKVVTPQIVGISHVDDYYLHTRDKVVVRKQYKRTVS